MIEFVPIDSTVFVSAALFGDDGYICDSLTFPMPDEEPGEVAVKTIRYLTEQHGYSTTDVWTSDKAIYAACLVEAGLSAFIKHPTDTESARRQVEDNREVLIEIFGIKPDEIEQEEEQPALPKWRAWLIGKLTEIIKKLEKRGNEQ